VTIALTTPEDQVRNLLDLPSEHFQTLVEKNLGQEAPAQLWPLLLRPEVVARTHSALVHRHHDLEGQLAERNARMEVLRQECHDRGARGKQDWFVANAEHQEWRGRALSYRRLIGTRMIQTKRLLNSATPVSKPRNPAKRVKQAETIFRLAWAIREHRDEGLELGIIPDEHDVALWRALDQLRVQTDHGPIPVSQYLDNITAQPGFEPPAPLEPADDEDDEEF
jgi:hypothetical protein